MPADITSTVIQIVGAVRASKSGITNQTALQELGIGELDRMELIMRLEDQFKLCIDDEAFKLLTSIQDVANYLSSLS